MRYARTLAVAGLVTAGLFATVGTASAGPIVDVKTAYSVCPTGYREIAKIGTTVVCYATDIPTINPPRYTITTSGYCPTGYTEYSVLGRYGVCIDLNG